MASEIPNVFEVASVIVHTSTDAKALLASESRRISSRTSIARISEELAIATRDMEGCSLRTMMAKYTHSKHAGSIA